MAIFVHLRGESSRHTLDSKPENVFFIGKCQLSFIDNILWINGLRVVRHHFLVFSTVFRSLGQCKKYLAAPIRGQEFGAALSEIPSPLAWFWQWACDLRPWALVAVRPLLASGGAVRWTGALTSTSAFAKMILLVMPRPSSWRSTRDMISPGLETA